MKFSMSAINAPMDVKLVTSITTLLVLAVLIHTCSIKTNAYLVQLLIVGSASKEILAFYV